MAEAIGTAVIEVVADARKLRAGIEDAKKSLRTLGEGQKDISKGASQSIDRYIGKLQQQNATLGKSVRETELFKLALRGASNEQIKTADAALRFAESQQKTLTSINALKTGFIALGAIAATSLVAAAVAFDQLVKKAGDFQDMAEKVGDSAEAFASLAVAAAVGGASMESVAQASVKLTKNLTGVDDESTAAGAAIEALGLNLAAFKTLAPADQMEAVAKALAGFEDSAAKSAVAMALFGKAGAEMIPFLKELAGETGRQNILTEEQIRLADEYSDKQKRLQAQISLYASAIASEMLPAYNDLQGAFLDVIKGIAGVEEGVAGIGNSTAIQDFAENAARFLALVVDNVDVVIRAFEILGKGLAAFAATYLSVWKFEFGQAVEIAKAAQADISAILNRPFLSEQLDRRIAERKEAAAGTIGPQSHKEARPALKFEGAAKKGAGGGRDAADTARQEAAAQLALDLEQIKKASEAQVNTLSNAQRIMEAMRSADLVSDKDYYASKLGFIKLNSQAQEDALQAQIARLQQETFVGKNAAKDRLDNDRKILDVQAQLTKARADAVTNVQINSIQEVAANKKIQQSYIDATVAANAYIEAIEKRNARELAGIGRGGKFRETQAGISAIEDKNLAERRRLEGELRRKDITQEQFDTYLRIANDTYSKEIALYHERTAAIAASEADWINGANEALNNYIDETKNVAKQTEEAWTNAFKGLEDELVNFTKTGKFNFKSLADSIVADLNRMFIKQNITGPLAEMMKGGIGAPGAAAGGGDLFGPLKALFGGGKPAVAEAKVEDDWPDLLKEGSKATEMQIDTITVATEATAKLSAQTLAQVTSSITTETALATLATAALSAATALQSMAASSAASSGSDIFSGASGLFTGDEFDLLGELASGINYVPETGIYKLHEGERVVPKSQNNAGMGGGVVIYQSFAPGTDTRTVNQAAAATGMQFRRAMARNT